MEHPDLSKPRHSPVPNILLAVFVLLVGNGLLSIYLSVNMAVHNTPTNWIGIVMSGYYLGFVLGTSTAHRIVNGVGHIRAFVTFAAIAVCTGLLHGVMVWLPVWFLLRIIFGFSFVGLYMVAESWLNHESVANRGHLLAAYTLVANLGVAAGQLMLGAATPDSLDLIIYVGLLISAGLLPIALTRAENPAIEYTHRLQLKDLFSVAPAGVVFALGSGVILGAYYTMAPVWGIQIGLQPKEVAHLMAVTLLGSLIFQIPIGKLSDSYDRRRVIGWTAIAITLLTFPIAIFSPSGPLLLLMVFLFGGLYYSLYPLAACIVADEFEKKQLVAASATLLQTWGLSAMLGPIVAAGIMSIFGPASLFYFFSVIALLLSIMGYHWRRLGHKPEQQSEFITVPRTTPIVTMIDPRSED